MFIYAIVCSESLKLYIGQHKGDSLERYLQQKYSRATHESGRRSHLYAAMRKYPRETWSIWPLVSGIEMKAELDEAEQLLIYALKAQHPEIGYNICDGGEGRTGPLSDETKRKLSVANRGHEVTAETRAKIAAHTGYKPPEFGETIRQALTGRIWTPEQREKIPGKIAEVIRTGQMKIHKFTPDERNRACQASAAVLTGVARSPEVMAACQTPEARAKRAATLKGCSHTWEARQHMSAGKVKDWARRANRTFSKDRNAKIAATMTGRAPTEALKLAHSPEAEEKRQSTRFLKTVAWG